MRDIIKHAFREIRRRRLRSIGNIAGYAVATAFLVISLTFAGFSVSGTGSVLEYTGAQFIGYVYATPGNATEIRYKNPDREGLQVYNYPVTPFPVEIIDVIRQSPYVEHASPLLTFSIVTGKNSDRSWVMAGFDPSDMEAVRMASCSDTDIVEGRFLKPGDRQVVLLEQTFADTEQFSTGDKIHFGDLEYTVAGILSPGTRPAKADIYMPFDEAVVIFNSIIEEPVRNIANVVLVDGASSILTLNALNDVKEILGFNSTTLGYGCFNPAGAAIGITFRGMRLTGLVIFVSIFLFIAASQYFAVIERRTDIGILKAIGWSDRGVLSQEVAGSFILTIVGGLAGCIVALLLFTIFPMGQWPGLEEFPAVSVNMAIVSAGFIVTMISGTLAGAVSAAVTLRFNPSEILRTI